MSQDKRVAIVGAALSDIGRVDDKTPFYLHFQAASRALADAGLTKDDVGGFFSTGMGALAPIEVAEYRHAGFRCHTFRQAAAAARHKQINGPIKSLHHFTDSGAVSGGHELDRL